MEVVMVEQKEKEEEWRKGRGSRLEFREAWHLTENKVDAPLSHKLGSHFRSSLSTRNKLYHNMFIILEK